MTIEEAIPIVERTAGIFTELARFDEPVCLDGHFDVEELEAIVVVMRAARQERA
jgi:hypothetical protein